jgi:superfamily I DNA and RNA helicase
MCADIESILGEAFQFNTLHGKEFLCFLETKDAKKLLSAADKIRKNISEMKFTCGRL